MLRFRYFLNHIKIRNKLNYCTGPNKKSNKYNIPIYRGLIFAISMYTGFEIYKRYKFSILDEEINERVALKKAQKANIGGDFNLIDQNSKKVSLSDFKGKWLLVYFGFCHCPDICPDQIEKLMMVVDRLSLTKGTSPIVPLFISIDSARDTPKVLKEYLQDFSDKLIGLTGSEEDIYAITRLYKIYYSKGPADESGDYMVDHSIIMYLIAPTGEFVEFYSQSRSVPEIVRSIQSHMHDHMLIKS